MRLALVAAILVAVGVPGDATASHHRERHDDDGSPHDTFGGPSEGQPLPTVTLKTLEGTPVTLADYVGQQPLVLELGSYTCPIFRQRHDAMEQLHAKYGKDVTFLTIYTLEAHPQGDPSPYTGREWVTEPNQREGILVRQPTTEAQRRALAQRARQDLGIRTHLLLDGMDDDAWRVFGQAPNAAYLIGTDGRVKLRQGWFEPGELEAALQRALSSE